VGLMELLWRRKWVVILAALVSAAAAMPALLSTPKGYTSRAELFLPDVELASLGPRTAAPVGARLEAYAANGLADDVRTDMGKTGSQVKSIDVILGREEAQFSLSVEAASRLAARTGTEEAAARLLEHHAYLARTSIRQVRSFVADRLVALRSERAQLAFRRTDLVNRIASLEASGASSEELAAARDQLLRLDGNLEAMRAERVGIVKLVEGASASALQTEAAASVLSGPTPPASDYAVLAIQTLGLALIVGVVVATLVIIWLERRVLLPAARSDAESGDATSNGMFHPNMPRRGQPPDARPEERRVRR
jgi:hypothetical protein